MNRIVEKYIQKRTLLGVGTMSSLCIEAAIMAAKENDSSIMFICSRNQIESKKFGGGYVNGWDSYELKKYISENIGAHELTNRVFIERDHGGPWQNDEEFRDKISWDMAMKNCLHSYYEDIEAGFDFLHIDTSRDPNYKVVPLNISIARAIIILKEIEKYRIRRNLPDVSYEISFKETNNTINAVDDYEYICNEVLCRFRHHNLPVPVFVVGNVGTYTKMDRNIGRIDRQITSRLYKIATEHGVYLKEHNADYLDEDVLRDHYNMGIKMVNVAPEFAKIETESVLGLETEWNSYVLRNDLGEEYRTNIGGILNGYIMKSGIWKKWVFDEKNVNSSTIINTVNGHYFSNKQDVIREKERLFDYLKRYNVVNSPNEYIVNQIKNSINRYLFSFM